MIKENDTWGTRKIGVLIPRNGYGYVMTEMEVITNCMEIGSKIDRELGGRIRKIDEVRMITNLCVEQGIIQGGELTTVGANSKENFEDDQKQGKSYWDDLSGKLLDPVLVKKAREEEMEEFRKHGVYMKVPIEECWKIQERNP